MTSARMLECGATAAVVRLAESVLAVKPLVDALDAPVRVVPATRTGVGSPVRRAAGQWSVMRGLLDRVAAHAGVTGMTLSRSADVSDLEVFERVVSGRLALADLASSAGAIGADLFSDVDQIVAAVVADGFDAVFHQETITSPDGVRLRVYAAGGGEESVVLVPACGMPACLAESWVRFLAADRRVLTWESRGLFGAAGQQGDYAFDLGAQVADLFAVMEHYGTRRAHVVGLCGGAVIALAAAAARPACIATLSLWHGAYFFAEDGQTTRHQQNLVDLMIDAAGSRSAARAVHAAFCQVMLTTTPADVAHLVLYPYATPELLYRYCRLNTGLTSVDVAQYLPSVRQPALVVTSTDDVTAHPAGSRRVAADLPNACLLVEAHGDHISLFSGTNDLPRVAAEFMTRHRPAGR